MKVHIFQHVAFEGPANILTWAGMKGADVTTTSFFEPGWSLPAPDGMDLLVVMGGPMSVHDDAAYPWLPVEKEFLRDAIKAGRRMVGICLGAQLAADALGARVYPNAQKEIGWFPIHKTDLPHPVLFDVAPSQHVLHWHGDTFDLPQGALHLAYSDACANQAFIWQERVLGLQFHMEMRPDDIETLMSNSFQETSEAQPFIQSDTAIRDGFHYAEMLPPLLDSVLTRFITD